MFQLSNKSIVNDECLVFAHLQTSDVTNKCTDHYVDRIYKRNTAPKICKIHHE